MKIKEKQSKTERFVKTISSYIKSIKPKLTFDENGSPEFGVDFLEDEVSVQTISDLLDLPEKMAENGQKVIVIFDEFQEIAKFGKYGLEGASEVIWVVNAYQLVVTMCLLGFAAVGDVFGYRRVFLVGETTRKNMPRCGSRSWRESATQLPT